MLADLEDRLKMSTPGFASTLKDLNIIEGSKAKFICKVTGHPEPEVKWLKNGREIKITKDITTTFDGE